PLLASSAISQTEMTDTASGVRSAARSRFAAVLGARPEARLRHYNQVLADQATALEAEGRAGPRSSGSSSTSPRAT
ncbi:MAG: hypothetical protein ACXWUH_16935, partial [Burkholderiales bacterium]